jgi:hypothetical protein
MILKTTYISSSMNLLGLVVSWIWMGQIFLLSKFVFITYFMKEE